MTVPSCAACALFHSDKDLLSHLRVLSSNKEAPYHFRCVSPWWCEGTAITSNDVTTPTKRKSGPDVSLVDTQTITPPPRKKRASCTPSHSTGLVVATPRTVGVTSASSRGREYAQSLTAFLLKTLSVKEEAIKSLSLSNKTLEKEIKGLQDRNKFLNVTSTELEQLVWQVRHASETNSTC
jgi:hypothetical protein